MIVVAVLKDVPSSPHQLIKDPEQDHIRMASYPNLEYGNLYNALAMLLDVAPYIPTGLNRMQLIYNILYQLFIQSHLSMELIIFYFSVW